MKSNPKIIPELGATPDIWISWYDSLKSNFGKKVASQLFTKAWKIRGRNTDKTTDFIKYMKENGITISTTSWEDIKVGASDIGDFYGNLFNVGKYAGFALLGITVIGVGMIVYNVAKSPAEALGTTLKYAK